MLQSQALTVTVNLLGLPAVAVPVAVEISNGLPQSVQIIGPSFREDRRLALARLLRQR